MIAEQRGRAPAQGGSPPRLDGNTREITGDSAPRRDHTRALTKGRDGAWLASWERAGGQTTTAGWRDTAAAGTPERGDEAELDTSR